MKSNFFATCETLAQTALKFYYPWNDASMNKRRLDRFAEYVEVLDRTPETIDY